VTGTDGGTARRDEPVLPWVFLPGTLCTGACFTAVRSALAERGIRPQASTFLPGAEADAAADAQRLLESAPERFVACAFSLGGFVAFQASLAAPERVAAMILIGVTGREDPAHNAPGRREQLERARLTSPADLVRDVLWPNYVAQTSLGDQALQDRILAMATDTGPERHARQTDMAIDRPNVLDALPGLRMPVLVISGAEDLATPPERGAEIAARLARGQHVTVPRAGHFVMMERPGATADEIAAWVGSASGDLSSR